jgi:peroxiredoxin
LNALLFTCVLALAYQASTEEGVSNGTKVELTAQTLEGQKIESHSLQAKPLLIVLWGTWSEPSIKLLDAIQRTFEKFQDKDIRIIAISTWDSLQNTQTFLSKNSHLKYMFWWDPAGADTTNSLAQRVFKVSRIPSVFILNRQHAVTRSFIGARACDPNQIEFAVELVTR